jgi:hypothetical protein
LTLFERRYPKIVKEMRFIVALLGRDLSAAATPTDWYERLPHIDFSRDVLEVFSSSLRLMRVPACGWSDLGTPKRVAQTLRRLEPHELHTRRGSSSSGPISLAMQHAHLARPANGAIGPPVRSACSRRL